MEVGTENCVSLFWRVYGVKSGAEVYKQDPYISPWSVQMLQDEVQSHDDDDDDDDDDNNNNNTFLY